MAEATRHHSPSECRSVVNDKVYDLIPWVPRHPSGQEAIAELFEVTGGGVLGEQHIGDFVAGKVLAKYQIGVLG